MKCFSKFSFAGAATLLLLLPLQAWAAPVIAANVTKKDGSNVALYVVGSYDDGILESRYESGVQPKQFPYSDIESIEWREPDEWKQAEELYTKRKWEECAAAYHAFFEKYRALKDIEDSFTALAKFRECEALRRLGKYDELSVEFENLERVKLSDRYAIQKKLFNAWGHLGNKLYGPLYLIAKSYQIEDSEIPAGVVRPAGMPFKPMDPQALVQAAYLRGVSGQKLAEKEKVALDALIAKEDERDGPEIAQRTARLQSAKTAALTDYARAMTLTYGSEPKVVKSALLNSLEMISKDPLLEEIFMKQREAHSLAVFYSKMFPGTSLPAEYQKFLAPPKPPEDE